MMAGHSTGQTLNDRLNAARYALAGQGLARVVCKATTEEMIAPKKKHIDYLLQCTNEPNVSIPQLANLLIERTSHSSWVVVFKALVTVHHLMCYGNERFTQYLASSNSNFQLSNYLDKTGPKCYDMSIFIRRYAKYLNTKALSYRTVAFDFTKIKRGGDGQLRAMNVDKLLKTIPVLQNQIDSLLEFDSNASDLTNGVINAAFFLLFKDLIRLFACYNDGIINTLEKYFEMNNKKQAREALEIYKKFLIRMNKVGEFLKVAENVGIDKGEIPDLTKAPSSLLDAMEQHLAQLEGKKPGSTTTTTTTTITSNGDSKPEDLTRKAIEEEEQFLNKLKEKHVQDKQVNNPFLAFGSPAAASITTTTNESKSSDILDLFANDSTNSSAAATKISVTEDLFSLNTATSAVDTSSSSNPFADILSSMNHISPATTTVAGGFSGAAFQQPNATNFATSDNFAAAFGSSSNSNIASIPRGFDAFGDVLQPQNVSSFGSGSNSNFTTTTAVPTSNNTNSVPSSASSQSLIKGDLDSSLASLAQNLDINGPKGAGGFKKGGQFNQSPKSMMKTGGNAPMSSNGASSTISSWSMPSAVTPSPVIGWQTNPMAPGGVGWSPVGSTAAASFGQPIIPGMTMGQPTPMMMSTNAMSTTMPMSYGMRQPNMIPGAVSVLPAGVTPATLSSALANRATNNNSTAPLSHVSDPFGAL